MGKECQYLEHYHFLIVEPNTYMRTMIRSLLRVFGAKVISEAANGEEALKELKFSNTDIVLTEWVMTPLNGIELTHKVRTAKDSPNPSIPIIMITAHTELGKVAAARDAGINEFVAKPMSAKSLVTRIMEVIERPRAFVKAADYIGPDRRRRHKEPQKGSERRGHIEDRMAHDEALTQDEIDAVVAGESISSGKTEE